MIKMAKIKKDKYLRKIDQVWLKIMIKIGMIFDLMMKNAD